MGWLSVIPLTPLIPEMLVPSQNNLLSSSHYSPSSKINILFWKRGNRMRNHIVHGQARNTNFLFLASDWSPKISKICPPRKLSSIQYYTGAFRSNAVRQDSFLSWVTPFRKPSQAHYLAVARCQTQIYESFFYSLYLAWLLDWASARYSFSTQEP